MSLNSRILLAYLKSSTYLSAVIDEGISDAARSRLNEVIVNLYINI